ncbi:12566_t:CDS:2 [Funneliformis geosporum]|uniref:12566_t:CDS:1 n=1 Tax=Funneliformis geosporum TaxID=1117311 RepID=A0A9W4SZY8_9GLOM|nr:12566_t:CDS:2 [Funneliformis geosporum]
MAGIPYPYFNWGDSILDFLVQFKLDLQNREIDPNDNIAGPLIGRDNVIGHLRSCMRGRTLEWFDDEITIKQNWKLTNLLDNTRQVNLVAILDTYESANPFPDTLTREKIIRVVIKAYGPPPKSQKSEKLQSFRINKLKLKIDKIGQMTSKFGRITLND